MIVEPRSYSAQIERRAVLERETVLEKLPKSAGRTPLVAVAYPSTYRTGMSNLGLHFLLRSFKNQAGVRVERVFSDTAPLTLESGSSIATAEAILFSVSYEEDYINLVRMLLESGVAPARDERKGRPFILAGGAAVSANPFPIAAVADAFCLGEGEGAIGAVVEALGSGNSRLLPDRLSGMRGIFVPGHEGRFAEITPEFDFPRSVIITPKTVFPNTVLIESGRGCPGACGFCLAKSLYGPYRAVSVEEVESYISGPAKAARRVGLVSTAVAAHPRFEELVELLMARGTAVSFGSLRAEDIDGRKARIIARAGTKSVAMAPESGSEAVRFRLGKRVADETYMEAAEKLCAAGVTNLGLYIMIGCPGETLESLRDTRLLLSRMASVTRGTRLVVHVNVLIPKPWTPLQYYGMPGEDELEKRRLMIRAICRDLGIAVKTKSIRSAKRQAVISLGDERVGKAIQRFAAGRISWRKALRSEGVDDSFPHEEKREQARFPWNDLEGPIGPGTLYRRYLRITGR
jgi:radical SAM superfamily enzyme YgiQ (UPF0313 family)